MKQTQLQTIINECEDDNAHEIRMKLKQLLSEWTIKGEDIDTILDEIEEKEKPKDILTDLPQEDLQNAFEYAFGFSSEIEKEQFMAKTSKILTVFETNINGTHLAAKMNTIPDKITLKVLIEHKDDLRPICDAVLGYGLYVILKYKVACQNDDEAVMLFEKYKTYFNTNMTDIDEGKTLLMWASDGCLKGVKRLLVEKDIDMDVRDINGNTALDIAKEAGRFDIIQELMVRSMGHQLKEKAKDKMNQLEHAKAVATHWFQVCTDESVMNGICDGMNALIRNGLPISDHMLFIALQWELRQSEDGNILNTSIYKTIEETLDDLLNIPLNKRHWNWFKLYLFDSCIWYQKLDDDTLLYTHLNALASRKLQTQKDYLRETIDALEEEKGHDAMDIASWNALKNYPEYMVPNVDAKEGLRQDLYPLLPYPTRSIFNEKDLIDIMVNTTSNFDAMHHNDVHSFLSRLITTAYSLNDIFHEEMQTIYAPDIKNEVVKYQGGGVKRLLRCQSKAETDYASYSFPSTAKILDFIRCSLTYSSPKQLIDGMNKLKTAAASQEYAVNKILRIKNMFLEHKRENNNEWNLYQYADVKMNVLLQHNNKSMIVEVQFLLDFMATAKSLGHGLYEISRNREFMNNVNKLRSVQFADLSQLLRNAVVRNNDKALAQLMFNNSTKIPIIDVAKYLVCDAIENKSHKALKFVFDYVFYIATAETEREFFEQLNTPSDKENALFLAIKHYDATVFKHIFAFEQIDVNAQIEDTFMGIDASLYVHALHQRRDEIIDLFLNDPRLNTPQMVKDTREHFDTVVDCFSVVMMKRLHGLVPDFDVNKKYEEMNTVLHCVPNSKDSMLKLEWFLSFDGVKVDEVNESGWSLWLNVFYDDDLELAKVLHERNDIDFKRKANNGKNAMIIAQLEGNQQKIEWLSSIGFQKYNV
eukprot:168888_1